MATLVNGNGNPAVYAQQDADLYVGVMGTTSCIMSVGSKFAATIETASLISVADGVILTKEGRRIQTDVGEVDEFNIPNGAAGVTRYYIIGYHLYTDGQGSQKCETFVQLMSSATDTIPEAEFRNGATEVYVSLYRVTQVGLTLNDPESLLPDALNIGDINASLTELGGIRYDETTHNIQVKIDDTWYNAMHIDPTELIPFVPTMTSNTQPYGECFADSNQSTAFIYQAFDNNDATIWSSTGSQTPGSHYIGYAFISPKIVTRVVIVSYKDSGTGNYNFKIQGSIDGTDWTDLTDVLTFNNPADKTTRQFDFENTTAYSRYRMVFVTDPSTAGSYYFANITGLQFYGYE